MAWVGGGKRMVADLTGPPCMECCRWKRLGDSFACSDALLICSCDDLVLGSDDWLSIIVSISSFLCRFWMKIEGRIYVPNYCWDFGMKQGEKSILVPPKRANSWRHDLIIPLRR